MAGDGVTLLPPPKIKPYLTYSFAVHCLLAIGALRLYSGIATKANPVYTIDFVGPTATIITAGPASSSRNSAPPPPGPSADPDEFGRAGHHKKHTARSKPSLLRGFHEKVQPVAETEAPKETEAPAEAPTAATPGDQGIATDMPNFPYPWYISQVRASLWSQWSSRMPKQSGEAVIQFSILPNGNIVDLRTEVSSGDSGFDLAAMSAVQDAAPYAPLPKGFADPFLKIHVTLKSKS